MQSLRDKKRLTNIFQLYNLKGEPTANLETAFRRAAATNKVEDLKFLLAQITDINKADATQGKQKTALHWAVINGHVDSVRLLVEAGARWDIPDALRKTAADYAKEKNQDVILELFSIQVNQEDSLISRLQI